MIVRDQEGTIVNKNIDCRALHDQEFLGPQARKQVFKVELNSQRVPANQLVHQTIGTLECGFRDKSRNISIETTSLLLAHATRLAIIVYETLLQHTLSVIADASRHALDADGAILWFWEDDCLAGQPRYRYEIALGKCSLDINREGRHMLASLGADALRPNKPIAMACSDDTAFSLALTNFQIRHLLTLPLPVGEKQGLLFLCFRHHFESVTASLDALQCRVSYSIKHAELCRVTRNLARRLATLQEVSAAILWATEEPLFTRLLVAYIKGFLGADIVCLYEYSDKLGQFSREPAVSGYVKTRVSNETLRGSAVGNVLDEFYETGQNLFVRDSKDSRILCPDRSPPCFVEREGIASTAAAVLRTAEETLGVLFVNYRKRRDFARNEQKVINSLMVVTAVALAKKNMSQSRERNMAITSHQLMSPVFVARWLLENAIRSVPPEGHTVLTNLGYAKTLLTAAFEMNHGLTMMLSGKIDIEPSTVRVKDELQRFYECLVAMDKEKQLMLRTAYESPQFPEIRIGDMVFQNVIYNLLSNAFKYADDKSELTVHWIYNPSTARTELRISGTGEPIKKEDRHRIFHPFTRGCEIQPTRYQAGFGMGLWLARELMRRVKGDLHVDLFENDPKRSEFVVTFPTEGPYAIRWPIKKEMW
jgi:signal transduction histidine kinase